jgi:ketosteroid isomerase-like protein
MDCGKDREAIAAIIEEMAASMSGAQSTRHWAEDALWFDIPAFASKGIKPASRFFDQAFGRLQSCKIDILEMQIAINGDMACAFSVQRITTTHKDGTANKPLIARQTDCFEKRNSEWKVIHEHTSVPKGADWDGKIITE